MKVFHAAMTAVLLFIVYFTRNSILQGVLAPRGISGFSRIFFLETGGRGNVTARMACAVESAARMHPKWTVYLLSVANGGILTNGSFGPFAERLRSAPNVVLGTISPVEEFKGTPLHEWYLSGALNESAHPVEHLADALRLAVIYNRGGIYIDIDVVVLRPLDALPSFVSQSPVHEAETISNGFLGFHRGDPYLWELMERAAANYNPEEWATIGPDLLLNFTLDYCGKRSVRELIGRRCQDNASFQVDELCARVRHSARPVQNEVGVDSTNWLRELLHDMPSASRVLHYNAFLPLPYDRWELFFKSTSSEEARAFYNQSYVLHVYNKMSSGTVAEPGCAYWTEADQHCHNSLQLSLDLNGNF